MMAICSYSLRLPKGMAVLFYLQVEMEYIPKSGI